MFGNSAPPADKSNVLIESYVRERRDEIAIKAMHAMLSNPNTNDISADIAELAYKMADAMLEARKK